MTYARVYVIKCKTPAHYYVGSSFRWPGAREEEHSTGHCVWTCRHGIDRYVKKVVVPFGDMERIENEFTMYFCARYGWEGVRGGDFTWAKQRHGQPIRPSEQTFFNMWRKGYGDHEYFKQFCPTVRKRWRARASRG